MVAGLLAIGLVIGLGLGRFGAAHVATGPQPIIIQPEQAPTDRVAETRPGAGPMPPVDQNAEIPTPEPPPQQTAALPAAVAAPGPKPMMTDGAWRHGTRQLPELGQTPVVALIIDDVGPDRRGTQRAIELPPSVTLSLLPYATDVAKIAARARAAGHEIMVHMPMEPIGDSDPGPDSIDAGMTPDQVSEALDKALGAFEGYVGLNNHMGSKATQDPAVMRAVMEGLRSHGLFFLDSRTTGKTVGMEAASDAGVPAISRDIFIDDNPSAIEIERQLTATEAFARRHGAAVAIAHPRAGSLDIIERWLAEVQQRGIYLVPISELVRRKLSVAQAG